MPSTHAALRAAVAGDGPRRTLTLDPAFQGLPGTAHGGTVVALFDALADVHGARRVTAHYRRRVPVATPLQLDIAGDAFAVGDATGVLVDGRVDAESRVEGAPAVRGDDAPRSPAAASAPTSHGLPVSRSCFACGVDNPLGLHARLAADEERVWVTWQPRHGLACDNGMLAPLAVTTLLDETAFWLGALASGESGMTTELSIRLHADDVAAAGAVTVVGARGAVRARDADPRYWDTTVAALDARGRLVAAATITFVAVRGAARRLVAGLRDLNEPETLRRVFPAYAGG